MAFSELNIGVSGLFAAQHGLSVTSNNITNAGTNGYSRQQIVQKASFPISGAGVGMIGTGVRTEGIVRVRDGYLDTKLWAQNDILGQYNIKATQNSLIETIFNETSDNGFTQVLNDLFVGFDNLSKLPGEGERQISLRQSMISFTKYFNAASSSLEKQQRDINFEVKATVDEINVLAQQVFSLSNQINQAELQGQSVPTLRDERTVCLDRLSEIIDIEAKEVTYVGTDGVTRTEFLVKANGQTLLDRDNIRKLVIEPRAGKQNPNDIEGLYEVKWEDNLPFDAVSTSGELKGLIDMRDGDGGTGQAKYNGVPYYMERLNQFIRTFAEKMNDAYNANNTTGTDYALFTQINEKGEYTDKADYSLMTAGNFSISASIYESASNIRLNYDHFPVDGKNPNPSGNDLLLELVKIKDSSIFVEGTPKDFMVSIFSELAVSTNEANMYTQIQTNVTKSIKAQRLSVSQVDTNEEFINLTKYQQAYQAAARIISVMDEIYENTIFRLGNQ